MCVCVRSNSIANRQPSRYNENASEQMKVCDWCGCICHRTGANLICWCLRRLSGNTGNESDALAGCTNFTWFVFLSVYRSGYVQIVFLCRAKFYFFILTHGNLNLYAVIFLCNTIEGFLVCSYIVSLYCYQAPKNVRIISAYKYITSFHIPYNNIVWRTDGI